MWTNKLDAYDWAIENLAANCHKTMSFSAGLRTDYRISPWKIHDYATASKGFVFWLNESVPIEDDMMGKICKAMDYKPGASNLGFGCNPVGDSLNAGVNKHNVGLVVGDFYANGSYWCSFPSKSFSQRMGQAIDAEPGKIYVSITWSDGDNIQYDSNLLFRIFKNSKRRGDVPVGWTLAATLQELNPRLLEFFYKNRTLNDEMMAGPSGFQFIYGDSYNKEGYNEWLDLNRKWMETAGFHTACIWNHTDIKQVDKYMSKCGLQGIFEGWNKVNTRYVDGVVAINQGVHCFKEGDVYNDLINVHPDASKPIFRNMYPITYTYGGFDGMEMLMRELEKLEAERPNTYVYLLPMDLCATLKKYIEKFVAPEE